MYNVIIRDPQRFERSGRGCLPMAACAATHGRTCYHYYYYCYHCCYYYEYVYYYDLMPYRRRGVFGECLAPNPQASSDVTRCNALPP